MFKNLRNKFADLCDYWRIRRSGVFDCDYYLKNNLDVARGCMNPIMHYIRYGWREGRNPSSSFNTNEYINQNADVKSAGINPLLYYLKNTGIKAIPAPHEENLNRQSLRPTTDKKAAAIRKNHDNLIEQNGKLRIKKEAPQMDGFMDYCPPGRSDSIIKAIAFYLPQFHPIQENNEWWGHGFTEWSNVTQAKPLFEGHYQPRLPAYFGFYDLRLDEIMVDQARVAREYGIYGFCYHYYWFNGKRLLEKPLEKMLHNPNIDIPFCLCWANENWTRRWDGSESEILISQNYSEDDFDRLFTDLLRHFKDPRYIKIDNKPVMIVYRANIIPKVETLVEIWKKRSQEAGFDGIYLIACQSFGLKDPRPCLFDAAVEFPPHTVSSKAIAKKMYVDSFTGKIYSYEDVVANEARKSRQDYKCFRTVMLSWDNTARRKEAGHVFADFSIHKYKEWLSEACYDVVYDKRYLNEEKFVFINAWNEWAEGTYLEPDRKYGFGLLKATHGVLNQFGESITGLLKNESKVPRKHDYAVIFHLYYMDLFDIYSGYIDNIPVEYDLFISLNIEAAEEDIQKVREKYPAAHLFMFPNKGRDIYPFLKVLKTMASDYKAVCKIHTKKTSYRNDTEEIRFDQLNALLGSPAGIKTILDHVFRDGIGVVGPGKYLLEHNEQNMYYNKERCLALAAAAGIPYEPGSFFAGSMFWFKPEAIRGIENIPECEFSFENEYADGTIAHAVERMILWYARKNGYSFESV